MNDQRILVPNPRIAARVVAGQALILDPTVDELKRLNVVGTFIWSKISERKHSQSSIRTALVEEFEVTHERAGDDLKAFIQKMEALNLIAHE